MRKQNKAWKTADKLKRRKIKIKATFSTIEIGDYLYLMNNDNKDVFRRYIPIFMRTTGRKGRWKRIGEMK